MPIFEVKCRWYTCISSNSQQMCIQMNNPVNIEIMMGFWGFVIKNFVLKSLKFMVNFGDGLIWFCNSLLPLIFIMYATE